jgi:hypothetical protein
MLPWPGSILLVGNRRLQQAHPMKYSKRIILGSTKFGSFFGIGVAPLTSESTPSSPVRVGSLDAAERKQGIPSNHIRSIILNDYTPTHESTDSPRYENSTNDADNSQTYPPTLPSLPKRTTRLLCIHASPLPPLQCTYNIITSGSPTPPNHNPNATSKNPKPNPDA